MTAVSRIFCVASLTCLVFGPAIAWAGIELNGTGATFPAPVYAKWIDEFDKAHPDVRIDFAASGSGAGIAAITAKTSDFAASDAPLTGKEKDALGGPDACLQIPTVAGAVVLAYNVPGLAGELKLDGAVLADIFLGNIKTWDDARIAALNPNVKLPKLDITTVHRTDGSGTTFIFTSYLCTQSPDFTKRVGFGKSVSWPNGQGGDQSKGVSAAVAGVNGAIGYVELTYALQNKISFATLKNKDGAFVKASAASVAAAGEGALEQMKGNLAVNIWNQAGKEAYPICSFTYLLIPKDLSYLKDENKAKALVQFVHWSTTEGEKLAEPLFYAPLSAGVQQKDTEALKSIEFNGKPLNAIGEK